MSAIYADGGDENDEEEFVAETKPAEKPILRGSLKLVDGVLTWSGKWAMGATKFSAGEKARFKYVFTGLDSGGAKVEQPKDVAPVSGKYTGSFMLKDPSATGGQVKIEENGILLRFTEPKSKEKMYDVVGTGENTFGKFKLVGKYDKERCRLAVEKEYLQSEDDDFQEYSEGEDAEDEIDEDGDDIDKQAELAALREEANMPVEELRKRYLEKSKEQDVDSKRSKTS